MPHDKNGIPLQVGDRVAVPCIVNQIGEGETYCNLTVETEEAMAPDDLNNKTIVTLSARMVEFQSGKGVRAPAAPQPNAPEDPVQPPSHPHPADVKAKPKKKASKEKRPAKKKARK